MIVIQGHARFDPAQLEALRPAAARMVAETRKEPGCIAYSFAEDLSEPGLMHIIERWTDEAAIAAHNVSPHMAEFGAALAQSRPLELRVAAYAASGEKILIGG